MELGLATAPGNADLNALQLRIASEESSVEDVAQPAARNAAQHGSRAGRQPGSSAPYRDMTEREMRGEDNDLGAVAGMNRLMLAESGRLSAMLRRVLGDAYRQSPEVPPFHTEMARAGWPAHCDVEACKSKARTSAGAVSLAV